MSMDQLKQKLTSDVAESSFLPEQRTATQLLNNIANYSRLIPFASNENNFWNAFWFAQHTPEQLSEIYQDFSLTDQTLPVQQAFLLVLLRLLETPRLLLNTLPTRHRSLYYHDLLGFTRQSSQPDRVAVNVTLQTNSQQYLLPAGTLLAAGQDAAGNTITYLTDDSVLLSRQRLGQLCWTRQQDPAVADSDWLLCTALDEDNNISLPAEGVRLFGATADETALVQRFQLQSPLAVLNGELQLVAGWDTDSDKTETKPLITLTGDRQPLAFQPTAVSSDQTVYRLPEKALLQARTRSGLKKTQLALQLAVGQEGEIPDSLTMAMVNCQDIGYFSQDNQGHINAFSYPFGVTPQTGNAFELVLPAAMAQTGGELTITPQWRDLPQESFALWYADYPNPPTGNDAFKVRIYLITPQGRVQQEEQPLFSGEGAPQSLPLRIRFPVDKSATSGYTVRVELTDPDFLHRLWQADPAGKNAPWTPQVNRIDTRFQYSLPLAEERQKTRLLQASAATRQALYLGFSDILAGETLSVYWSLNAPSALELKWFSYNPQGEWTLLEGGLDDQTAGLFASGLWQAMLPDTIAPGGDGMADDYYWIKAVPANGVAIAAQDAAKLQAIFANAITATLNSETDVDDSHFSQALPAGTITGLVTPVAEISSVSQPLPSGDGKPRESENALFQRAAARLSHRQRAITWGNMRRMLMEQYPQLFDVKFPDVDKLNHIPALETQQLLVIPDTRYRDNDDALRPALSASRLQGMTTWLTQYTSLWASPVLNNPNYIDVIARYQVVFKPGVNQAWGYRQLAVQLQQQYMPWGEDLQQGVTTGNQIDYFTLQASLQRSPLVQRVLSLTLSRSGATPQAQTITAQDNEVLILIPQADTSSLNGEAHV